MEYEFVKFPNSVVTIAKEIIRVVNDYNARVIGNDELTEILLWYANKYPDKLFQGVDYNTSIKQIIGVRRVRLLDTILDGYQTTLFKGVK